MPNADSNSFLNLSSNNFFIDESDGVRSTVIGQLERSSNCDVLVVGGSIWGAAFAWQSAFNGLKTILLEQDDYGQHGWSGWYLAGSNLSLHSFIRQALNFTTERRIFRAFATNAKNLLEPCQTVVLTDQGHSLSGKSFRIVAALKKILQRGLVNLGSGTIERNFNHHPSLKQIAGFKDFSFSAQLLTLDMIQAARQEGACCLNHAAHVAVNRDSDNRYKVKWRDLQTGVERQLTAGVVVDCSCNLSEKIVQFQFDRGWEGPSVIICEGKEHPRLTVFNNSGFTIVEVDGSKISSSKLGETYNSGAIEGVLTQLRRFLPGLSITINGLRAIRICSKPDLRMPIFGRSPWVFIKGFFSLQAGEVMLAQQLALNGLMRLLKIAGVKTEVKSVLNRTLPGSGLWSESVENFLQAGRDRAIPEDILQGTVNRMGSRVRFIVENDNYWELVADSFLVGEVVCALRIHQAVTIEDLLERRFLLDKDYLADKSILEGITTFFNKNEEGLCF